jgi:hypothetical protein
LSLSIDFVPVVLVWKTPYRSSLLTDRLGCGHFGAKIDDPS